jgi:hypothetical protein
MQKYKYGMRLFATAYNNPYLAQKIDAFKNNIEYQFPSAQIFIP